MPERIPPTIRTVLGLLLLGAVWWGGWNTWIATRIWVPLNDAPVAAGGRYIRTPEFEINVTGNYQFMIGRLAPPTSRWEWRLVREGRVVARGWGGPEAYPWDNFSAAKGRYVLEAD